VSGIALSRRSPSRQRIQPDVWSYWEYFFPVEEGRFKFLYRVDADGTEDRKRYLT
jgi:hypothetical protein